MNGALPIFFRNRKMAMTTERKDTRIPYSFNCTWWDSIDKVGLTKDTGDGHRLPCCPHCGSMLMEMDSEATWFAGVDRYEAAGHPGYRALVEWARGKCFPNYVAAKAAFAARPVH